MHTPGHGPEHSCFLVEGHLLTGDSLLIGDAARRDLAVDAVEGAEALFASLKRLAELQDEVEVDPGHTGGSLCGAGLSGDKVSTIGSERLTNHALRDRRPGGVRRALGRDLGAAPADGRARGRAQPRAVPRGTAAARAARRASGPAARRAARRRARCGPRARSGKRAARRLLGGDEGRVRARPRRADHDPRLLGGRGGRRRAPPARGRVARRRRLRARARDPRAVRAGRHGRARGAARGRRGRGARRAREGRARRGLHPGQPAHSLPARARFPGRARQRPPGGDDLLDAAREPAWQRACWQPRACGHGPCCTAASTTGRSAATR